MSKKYLHVKEGVVKAITLEGERTPPYGEVIEVALDAEIGVGDAYVVEAAQDAKPAKSKK